MLDKQYHDSVRLLDEAEDEAEAQRNNSSCSEKKRRQRLTPKAFPPWIACLVFFAILVGVLTFPLIGTPTYAKDANSDGTSSAPSASPPSTSALSSGPHGDHVGQLAIQLHPAAHSLRDTATLTFEWNVTLGLRAPDGVEKQVYLVNGQFPGPTIEARSGDRIVVHVHNGLEAEGVSLHWHGLRMRGYNAMDGAVGFTQCPIPAGGSFVYDFKVGDGEHGTFWWHSHSSVQRADGLFGGLVVHKPRQNLRDGPKTTTTTTNMTSEDEALLLVGDWFHRRQTDVLAWYADAGSLGNEPVPDSVIVNGRGRYNCSMAVPARPVRCSGIPLSNVPPLLPASAPRTRLRVVNTGTIAGLTLRVDGATLRALAVDGGCSVDSQPADSVGILYPGERVDLVLEWKESRSQQPWLNIYLDDENFGFHNPALNPNHTFPALPDTLAAMDEDRAASLELGHGHQDLSTLSATESLTPVLQESAEETIILLYIKTQKLSVYNNRPMGFINHTSWQPQALPLLSQNRSSWDSHQFVPFIGTGSKPTRVKLVLNNLDDGSHPFHLHGYSFHVLSTYRADGRNGFGSYNPYETPEDESPGSWNRDRPLLKDTITVPRRGHAVLTFTADNSGIWMLHCHMLVHLGTGMAAGFHVGEMDDGGHVYGERDASVAKLCDAAKR